MVGKQWYSAKQLVAGAKNDQLNSSPGKHVISLSSLVAAFAIALVQPQDASLRVHDFADLLSPAQRAELESIAHEVEQKTTAQIAIVTVRSLDGSSVDQYANELFRAWGIGKQKVNNGVLFLCAPNERRVRI